MRVVLRWSVDLVVAELVVLAVRWPVVVAVALAGEACRFRSRLSETLPVALVTITRAAATPYRSPPDGLEISSDVVEARVGLARIRSGRARWVSWPWMSSSKRRAR
jgi:hypothetical protein